MINKIKARKKCFKLLKKHGSFFKSYTKFYYNKVKYLGKIGWMPIKCYKKMKRREIKLHVEQCLCEFEILIDELVQTEIPPGMFYALVSFSSSIGESQFEQSAMLNEVNNNKIFKACDQFDILKLGSLEGGKLIFGKHFCRQEARKSTRLLKKRRKAEKKLYLS